MCNGQDLGSCLAPLEKGKKFLWLEFKGQVQGSECLPFGWGEMYCLDSLLWAAGHSSVTRWHFHLRTDHYGVSNVPQSVETPSLLVPKVTEQVHGPSHKAHQSRSCSFNSLADFLLLMAR